MLPILCGIACAVLVILDVSGKLHPERTRSQVLLHLFSLSGALLPLMLAMLSPAAFLDDAAAMNPVFRVLCTLPSPVQWGTTAVDERAWAWAARQEPNLSTPCEPS